MHFFFSLGFSSCTFFGVGGIAEWNKDDTQLLRISADFFSFAPGLSSWLILNEIKHIAIFCPGSDWMNRRHVHFWMRSGKWSSKTTLYFYQVGDHGEQTKQTNTKYAFSFALGCRPNALQLWNGGAQNTAKVYFIRKVKFELFHYSWIEVALFLLLLD